MEPFPDRLIEAIRFKRSCVVVGLDPHPELMPAPFRRGLRLGPRRAARSILEFNKIVIDIVAPYAVAVKPQIAFYEVFGAEGISIFISSCSYAQAKGLLVIADVKRGDIGETSRAYARAYFGGSQLQVDAVTLNPYFGYDGVEPFISAARDTGGGVFILVKTTNPSSVQIQDLRVKGGRLYEVIARYISRWGRGLSGGSGYSCVGAVVAATYPVQAGLIRAILKRSFLLVPGYGAQGGKAQDLRHYFNPDGLGALISASRSILFAYRDKRGVSWEKAVQTAALRMRDEINQIIG
jgi:orotidine-5'-phosphate decarboxylase